MNKEEGKNKRRASFEEATTIQVSNRMGRLVYHTGREGKKNQASNEKQQEGDLDG